MPKLDDVETDQIKSFLDFLITNGAKGAKASTDEEREKLMYECMDKMDETPLRIVEEALASLELFGLLLKINYKTRKIQEEQKLN